MRKIGAVAMLTMSLLLLTACGDDNRETFSERIDRLYAECLAAGGSFEVNASLPYWACTIAEPTEPQEGNTP